LIVNSSLEDDPGADGLPTGWARFAVPADGYKFSIDEGGRSGDHALLIEGSGEYGGIVTTRIQIDRSKQYAARGWVKMEGDPKATGTVKLDYYDADAKYLGSTFPGIVVPEVIGWQHVAVADRASDFPTATTIAVVLALTGQGSAWFDDLELITRDRLPGVTRSNLIVNGNMESAKGRMPANWYLGTNEGARVGLFASAHRPKDGWYAMHLRGNAEWAVAISDRIKLDRSKTYTLMGYARARTGKAQIKIDYFQDDKNLGETTSNEITSDEWQMRTVKAELNRFPQATHIAVAGVGKGVIDVWFDAFTLTVE
jgi:hypothetical protein